MPPDFDLLPNFFIIGAVKSGTTTLYDTLRQYPDVYLPPKKEPAFFCVEEYYRKEIEWYQQTFYAHAAQFPSRGDATPRYLIWSEKVAPRIKALYQSNPPKFIVILRHPVELAYSYYWQNVRDGREPLSFQQALDQEEQRMADHDRRQEIEGYFTYEYSKVGCFAAQLQPFLNDFTREQFLFLLTDDLQDFQQAISKVENFLGIGSKTWLKPVQSNSASLPRSRRTHQWLRQRSRFKDFFKSILPYNLRFRLKSFAIQLNLKNQKPPPLKKDIFDRLLTAYRSDIEQLATLIDRDLSSWLERTGAHG